MNRVHNQAQLLVLSVLATSPDGCSPGRFYAKVRASKSDYARSTLYRAARDLKQVKCFIKRKRTSVTGSPEYYLHITAKGINVLIASLKQLEIESQGLLKYVRFSSESDNAKHSEENLSVQKV